MMPLSAVLMTGDLGCRGERGVVKYVDDET